MRLKDQSVLVTGAARGIGEAIALAAAKEGARVTAVDLHADPLDALLAKATLSNLTLQTVIADISTADGNAKAASAAETRFGPLNAFVANAAVIRFADPLKTTEQDWDAIHRV